MVVNQRPQPGDVLVAHRPSPFTQLLDGGVQVAGDMTFGLVALTGHRHAPGWSTCPTSGSGAPTGLPITGRLARWPAVSTWQERPAPAGPAALAGSIHTGAVRPSDAIRVLSRGGNPTLLGEAVMRYRRVHKSLHMLGFVDDE